MKVVGGIICKCLSLEEAMIEQEKHIRVKENGKGLVKARQSSHDELFNVLKQKAERKSK